MKFKVFSLAVVMFMWAFALQAQNEAATDEGTTDGSWASVYKNKKGTLQVNYFDNHPFSYKNDKGEVVGIEVEIMQAFVEFLKNRKDVELTLEYTAFEEFPSFYESIKREKNGVIGLGSVTISEKRKAELTFSPAYISNTALLVTSAKVPTLTTQNEMSSNFANMVAVAVAGSAHEALLAKVRQNYFPNMKIEYVATPEEVLNKVADDTKFFGYVDIVAYGEFIKNNKNVRLKRHFAGSSENEFFGFIMPKSTDWGDIFTEFMEGGFGFRGTVTYENILNKYLPWRVADEVAVAPAR